MLALFSARRPNAREVLKAAQTLFTRDIGLAAYPGPAAVLRDDGAVLISDIGFRRTAAAQFLAGTLTLADGRTETISMTSRRAGFFVPMGRETDGPAFGTYDDFMTLHSDGRDGAGFVEQGIVHRVC